MKKLLPLLAFVALSPAYSATPEETAREVLAKHDENYMPPEAAEAMAKAKAAGAQAQSSSTLVVQP